MSLYLCLIVLFVLIYGALFTAFRYLWLVIRLLLSLLVCIVCLF